MHSFISFHFISFIHFIHSFIHSFISFIHFIHSFIISFSFHFISFIHLVIWVIGHLVIAPLPRCPGATNLAAPSQSTGMHCLRITRGNVAPGQRCPGATNLGASRQKSLCRDALLKNRVRTLIARSSRFLGTTKWHAARNACFFVVRSIDFSLVLASRVGEQIPGQRILTDFKRK